MKTKKKTDKTLILTTLLCLIPILFGLMVSDRLPDQIGVHWNIHGDVDRYASKYVCMYLLPGFMALVNVLCHVAINNDPKKENASRAIVMIGKWIAPVLSLILVPVTLLIALGSDIKVEVIATLIVGMLITLMGNYLPKCRQSYTVGIRLPWTLDNEVNWNKTHHFAGYLWTAGGILIILTSFFKLWYIMIGVIAVIVIVPVCYSFMLHKKGY